MHDESHNLHMTTTFTPGVAVDIYCLLRVSAVPRDLPKSYRVVQFREKAPQGACRRFVATYLTKSSRLK